MSPRKVKFFITVPFVIIFLITELKAQNTLPDLLEQAVKNYPGIKAKKAENESALRDVAVAKWNYMPRITAQHQYTYGTSNSLAGAFYPTTGVISPSGSIRADNNSQAAWGSYTTAIFEWDVFNFGKVSSNIKAYRKAQEATNASYENELLQHKVRVADAYLLTLMYQKLVSIQEVNLERAQTFVEVVNAGVLSGIRPGVDSSLASAELVKAKLLLLQAKREQRTQSLGLQELTGSLSAEDVEIDSMRFFTTHPLQPDTARQSLRSHPLLRYYQLQTEASEAKGVAIKRSFLPSITLVGAAWARGSGISPADDSYHTDFSEGTRYQVQNYLLGASARWTISDFGTTRQQYKSAYYKAVRDQEHFNTQYVHTQRQLIESEMQYNISLEQANTAPVQLTAAQGAYRQASARFESGLTDLPTFMQSIVTLNRAEADLAISYINVWRSLLAIAAAKGNFALFMNATDR